MSVSFFSPLPNRKNSPLIGESFRLFEPNGKKTRKHPWTNEKILNSMVEYGWCFDSYETRYALVGNIFREKTRAGHAH